MWDRLGRVWGSEFVLCVGQFWVGLRERECALCGTVWGGSGGLRLCCVWESYLWVWWSVFVLCVGKFGVGLGE